MAATILLLLQLTASWAAAAPLAAVWDNTIVEDSGVGSSQAGEDSAGHFGEYWRRRFNVYSLLAEKIIKQVTADCLLTV